MRVIGIREMKNKLSELVRAARRGETVLVTDRGTAVAELRQVGAKPSTEVEPGLEELLQAGLVRPGAANDPSLYPALSPLTRRTTAGELLDEERGER